MNREIDKLVELYSRDVTKLCINLCGNLQDSEDLFQDTWHKALKNFEKYDHSKPFDKWIFSICVNTYKNSLKLAYNKRHIYFESDEESRFFFSSIPDNSVHTEDEYAELHKIIGSLPKKQRVVIVLKFFKDYSISEIAEILSLPEGTVKSRLHSAKANIRRRLSYEEK